MTFNNILKNVPSAQTVALERPQIAAAAWSNTVTVSKVSRVHVSIYWLTNLLQLPAPGRSQDGQEQVYVLVLHLVLVPKLLSKPLSRSLLWT